MNRSSLVLLWCVSTAALISWPGLKASGESALRLSLPEKYGTINANTYDEDGNAVGDARLVIATDKDGNTVLEGEAGITHSASTTYSIVLEPTKHSKLKPLLQKSHSIDVEGNSLGMLTINHVKGFASCSSSESDPKKKIRTLKLPSIDLVCAFVEPQYSDSFAHISERIRTYFAPRAFIGCTAVGIVGGAREIEHQPAIALSVAQLPDVDLHTFHLDALPGPDEGPEAWELSLIHI